MTTDPTPADITLVATAVHQAECYADLDECLAEGVHRHDGDAMNIVCLYQGRPGECQECGFFDETGTGFCSHECRQARADREARHAAELQARRAEEDAFGDAVERLRAAGHTG